VQIAPAFFCSSIQKKLIEVLYEFFLSNRLIDTTDAKILTDHKSQLAKLYNPAAKAWKKSYNDYYQEHFRKK
jgi:hypothetical protein